MNADADVAPPVAPAPAAKSKVKAAPAPAPTANLAPAQTVLVILRRFTNVAVGAVVLFALTGLYSAWRQVGYPAALVGSTYGITLIIKNVMLIPLLFIGLINTLLLRPDLLQKAASVAGALTRRRALPALTRTLAALQAVAASSSVPQTILRYVRIEALLGASWCWPPLR